MKINLLIIGGDGDLALRKLYPALYSLQAGSLLNSVRSITAMARTEHTTQELKDKINKKLSAKFTLQDDAWNSYSDKLMYHTGDATSVDTMRIYKENLAADNKDTLLVYLAVPPRVFGGIAKALGEAGLANEKTRIIVEKPLGEDKQSFLAIDQQLNSVFSEQQIYRIDHYLGKESVQNLLPLRFSNLIFSELWQAKYIDSVQITVAETVGVEKRADFYDETGALRDMVQNHLLQILCLVAMEPPAVANAETIRAEKLKVLKELKPISLENINMKTIRGQYAKGSIENKTMQSYAADLGHDSDTETYVAIKAEINNQRWARVPFYLRTGKRLSKRFCEINIFFKPLKNNIFDNNSALNKPNYLQIVLQPDSKIILHVMNKKPILGNEMQLQAVELSQSHTKNKSNVLYDAYARLLLDAINQDQTHFISAKEVEASWEWIDGIVENWKKDKTKVYPYQSGSMGPSQAHDMFTGNEKK